VALKYEEKKPFYELVWSQLTLALAIAVQGEVAILDRLTGVHNREYFMKRLVQEVERSNRYQLPISVVMLDIDKFKLVNAPAGTAAKSSSSCCPRPAGASRRPGRPAPWWWPSGSGAKWRRSSRACRSRST
jgi:hypothetical protein